jgi:hypothetical protein
VSGFDAPDWSVRVSFANLNDPRYDDIGRAVRAVARSYRQAYEATVGNAAPTTSRAKAVAQGKPAGATASAKPAMKPKTGQEGCRSRKPRESVDPECNAGRNQHKE